jgi:hypothetical protein
MSKEDAIKILKGLDEYPATKAFEPKAHDCTGQWFTHNVGDEGINCRVYEPAFDTGLADDNGNFEQRFTLVWVDWFMDV